MHTLKVTTRTREEIDAAFEAAFKAVRPAGAVTQEQRLAPYRKAILRQRRRGLSWGQIAQGMRHPMIGEIVSDKLLKRMFGTADQRMHTGGRRTPRPEAGPDGSPEASMDGSPEPSADGSLEASAGAVTDAAPRPADPPRLLVLDPLTGRRIT